jgi:glycyl-tRNA synthetase beta chain
MGTPRRLVLCVREVAEKQDDQLIEKVGPATRAAFDGEGNPTKAAMGFARGQGLEVSELETITNDKGEYLCARKKVIGEDTATFLSDTLPRLITSIPFQKSMRWMNLDLRFARPIHWILALFGGEVVPFKLENIESGPRSFGHRFMSPEFFEVTDFEDYLKKTNDHHIIADPEKRKSIIIEEARKAANDVAGEVLENEDLLDEVTFLVEYPSVVLGNFDREYLDLPKEVLTTSMIKHQKYFPVTDREGKLLPHFITVNNTLSRDPAVVARGNEKVIRARLADAQFFFEEDQKTPLEDHLEDLKDVVFHSTLGTSYEKVMQFRELALFITETLNLPVKDTVDRVALLAKADLETQMVYEFTELQGVMGREYARIQGEDPVVAKAIYEHYLPIAAGGDLPETDEGAIVSIADKMDTIVGFFGIKLIPTGTADPFALRRQALGIINIILNKNYPLNLDALIDKSIAILGEKLKRKPEETKADVLDFFRGRFENQLISQGHPYDVVNAVLALGLSDIAQSLRKIEAMEDFKGHPDYEPLAVAFKRVVNILKDFDKGSVDTAHFQEKEEENLYSAFCEIKEKVGTYIGEEKYKEALSEVARLRKPVDAFFDTVLVMSKDEKVKFNRLSLLEELKTLFYGIADFTKIVTDG